MAAITPQFPLPLPAWAKFGLKYLPFAWGVAEQLLDHPGSVQSNGDLTWRRAAVHWRRGEGSQSPEDDAICTFDFVNITSSEVDNTWTTADYDIATAHLVTFLTEIAPLIASTHGVKEIRFYRMQFASPMTDIRRFVPSGPPERISTVNVPGASLGEPLPSQVAYSVTERTAIPRHWGRFYLPGLTESSITGNAQRWNAGTVDAITNATTTMYTSFAIDELYPVVVSTQADKVLAGSLIGVTHVASDNIPDVIRRRRLDLSTYTNVKPT